MTQTPAPLPTPESPANAQLRHQRLLSELTYWRSRRDSVGCLPHVAVLILAALGFLFLGSPWNFLCLVVGGVTVVLGMIAMTNQSTAVTKVNEIERAIREIELGK